MQELEKGLSAVGLKWGDDQGVDLIDIRDAVGVDPDDRDDVEEGPTFVVELRVGEDGVIDIL